ncbi:MAG: glycoside hydrolase family 38 C-terminal domain-containing protein [Thermomicrobiales bacterium]
MPNQPLRKSRPLEGLAAVRQRYVDSTAATLLETPAGTIRISNVPLFRDHPTGEGSQLQQAIRLRLPASDAGTVVKASVLLPDADSPADTAIATLGNEPQSLLLFVPEVESEETVFVTVRTGGEEHSIEHLVAPQRKFTIHLVHHSHYDIGYTDPQSTVLESQLAFIDYALELATLTDDWEDDAKFRWNLEVNWPLKHWLRTRPKARRDELLRRIAEGRIEVHALPFSMHTEAYSQDELAQQLVFTRELREDWGIDIVSAMQTDVPGATIGLASLLTDAGIRYLAVAHNYAGISTPYLNDGQDLTRPFWWEAPDGEKLLVWYADSLIGDAYMEAMHNGFGHGYDDVIASLPEYLNAVVQLGYPHGQPGNWMNVALDGIDVRKQPYPYDILHLRVQGAFADNASSSLMPATIIREWNERWAWPKLRSSLDRDFFADMESRIGDQLETYAGDWTDWWAIGVGSAAFALGRNRKAQADLRTAQTLNALADVVTDEPLPSVAADVQAAYEEMALFDEHTWGAANPWDREADMFSSGAYQWTRKEAFAYTAEERTTLLHNGGLQRIAPLAATGKADVSSLVVFNPSTWMRTDLARVFVTKRDLTLDGSELVLIDAATGEPVPALFGPTDNPTHRPHGWIVEFVAKDVPAIGYRRYRVVRGKATTTTISASTTIANDALSVEVDAASGSIRHLIDRATGRDLVNPDAPFGFGAVIHDRYTTAPGFNHLSSRLGQSAGMWLLGKRRAGRYGHILETESNAVRERIRLRLELDGTDWVETTITLPHGTSRLHLSHRLHKPVSMEKESLYVAFPFAAPDPIVKAEITGGIVGPDSPHVPGSLDRFRTLRHWATIESADTSPVAWATTEAPLTQFGTIHIPYAPFMSSLPEWQQDPATIYSWALNNIWDTNFPPAQGGELRFSYVVATGGEDALTLGKDTGAAAGHPLVGVAAPAGATPMDLPDTGSFASVAHPAVEITHLAPARAGGIAVFLYSQAAETVETTLRIDPAALPATAARIGTFLETGLTDTPIHDGAITVTIAPGETRAIVLTFA